jgi:hypothetical protein
MTRSMEVERVSCWGFHMGMISVTLLVITSCVVWFVLLLPHLQLRGEFVRAVGSEGDGVGQFNKPGRLALSPDETRLLVADYFNARVVVTDAIDGQWVRTLQGPAGTLVNPTAVAMVRTGEVLVVDFTRDVVVVFAGIDDDTVVRTLGDGAGHGPRQLYGPQGIAVLEEGDAADRPVAVIADTCNHRLSLFRVDDNTLLRHIGSEGKAPGQFYGPIAVSVVSAQMTESGEVWLVVSDRLAPREERYEHPDPRVQVLTLLGAVVRVLKVGDGVGRLSAQLQGVKVCVTTSEVLVSDAGNHRVVSWRLPDGGGCRVVCGSEAKGSGDGQSNDPWWARDMVTTSSGALHMWMVDGANHRLCLFQ